MRKKIAVAIALASGLSLAADRVAYANATLDIEPGARSAALGSTSIAVDGDYLGLISNPQQLANVDYTWVNFSHTAYYEDTQYDFASVAIPLSMGGGLGVALSRFGAEDIPYIREGEDVPLGSSYNTLAIADYVLSVSWGRKFFNRLDFGVSFHGLYRDMDQTGWGFRGDAGVRFRAVDSLYLSGLLKGWTSSATSWESGEFEYSSPEFYLAASYKLPVNYLYGSLGLYWQGAGIFHREARDLDLDTDESAGGRLWEDPFDWLSGGRGGLEFNFDFGLSLRAGLSSFTTWQSVTAGAGIVVASFLKIDYAFESHPVLSPVHRVSISVSPYLFSHSKPEGHLTPADAAKSVLAEEPEEVPVEELAREEAPAEKASVPEEQRQENAVPAEQEAQEMAPAGGMYWEE
jgi:hypothetical protein